MQAALIAGLLGVLTAWSPHASAASVHTAMACPAAKSEAHRALLKSADEQVEAGKDDQAARSFVAAFDAMDLADRVGSTGKFAADRAVTSFLTAWRVQRNVALLDEAEAFLLRYLELLEEGRAQGCNPTDRSWADEKLAEVRAERPAEPDPAEPDPTKPEVTPPPKDCPAAPAIIGVDRVGVALVTVGASLFASGTAFLVVGLVDGDVSRNPGQGFTISGGVIMGAGVAFLIPGAVRLATWRRRQGPTRLGLAPMLGRDMAGLTLSGRFGARR